MQFLLLVLAGWVNRQQQDVIDYLREETRVLPSPSRPPTAKDIREFIVRGAQANPTWGYTRLQGARKNLKHRH